MIDREIRERVERGRLVGARTWDRVRRFVGELALDAGCVDRSSREEVSGSVQQAGDRGAGGRAGRHRVGVTATGGAVINVVTGDGGIGARVPREGDIADGLN